MERAQSLPTPSPDVTSNTFYRQPRGTGKNLAKENITLLHFCVEKGSETLAVTRKRLREKLIGSRSCGVCDVDVYPMKCDQTEEDKMLYGTSAIPFISFREKTLLQSISKSSEDSYAPASGLTKVVSSISQPYCVIAALGLMFMWTALRYAFSSHALAGELALHNSYRPTLQCMFILCVILHAMMCDVNVMRRLAKIGDCYYMLLYCFLSAAAHARMEWNHHYAGNSLGSLVIAVLANVMLALTVLTLDACLTMSRFKKFIILVASILYNCNNVVHAYAEEISDHDIVNVANFFVVHTVTAHITASVLVCTLQLGLLWRLMWQQYDVIIIRFPYEYYSSDEFRNEFEDDFRHRIVNGPPPPRASAAISERGDDSTNEARERSQALPNTNDDAPASWLHCIVVIPECAEMNFPMDDRRRNALTLFNSEIVEGSVSFTLVKRTAKKRSMTMADEGSPLAAAAPLFQGEWHAFSETGSVLDEASETPCSRVNVTTFVAQHEKLLFRSKPFLASPLQTFVANYPRVFLTGFLAFVAFFLLASQFFLSASYIAAARIMMGSLVAVTCTMLSRDHVRHAMSMIDFYFQCFEIHLLNFVWVAMVAHCGAGVMPYFSHSYMIVFLSLAGPSIDGFNFGSTMKGALMFAPVVYNIYQLVETQKHINEDTCGYNLNFTMVANLSLHLATIEMNGLITLSILYLKFSHRFLYQKRAYATLTYGAKKARMARPQPSADAVGRSSSENGEDLWVQ